MNSDKKKYSVSIIIPLYKGQCYLENIFRMVTANYSLCVNSYNLSLELIFVNDYPGEKLNIEEIVSRDSKIHVIVKERETNGGIHAARIDGLKLAKGEYVSFLDQDDLISDRWLMELLSVALRTDSDVVVCNGWRSRFKRLTNMEVFKERLNDINFYIDYGNAIVSPGQVLLKKSIIPAVWINNVKIKNGCDDHLLWLILKKNKVTFFACEKDLFFHNPERHDYSISQNKFRESYIENIEILKGANLINEDETDRMYTMADKYKGGNVFSAFDLLERMYSMKCRGRSISDYLISRGINEIAIYGVGRLGGLLIDEMESVSINVKYIIDKDAEDFYSQELVLKISDKIPPVDLIIDTTLSGIESNELAIIKNRNIEILRLHELIERVEKW